MEEVYNILLSIISNKEGCNLDYLVSNQRDFFKENWEANVIVKICNHPQKARIISYLYLIGIFMENTSDNFIASIVNANSYPKLMLYFLKFPQISKELLYKTQKFYLEANKPNFYQSLDEKFLNKFKITIAAYLLDQKLETDFLLFLNMILGSKKEDNLQILKSIGLVLFLGYGIIDSNNKQMLEIITELKQYRVYLYRVIMCRVYEGYLNGYNSIDMHIIHNIESTIESDSYEIRNDIDFITGLLSSYYELAYSQNFPKINSNHTQRLRKINPLYTCKHS